MTYAEQVTAFYEEVNLKPDALVATGQSVILHTHTGKYLLGSLGLESATYQYYNTVYMIHRSDCTTDSEFRQKVLEDFEDLTNSLDESGINTDFKAEQDGSF